jgi:hypothetical protein
MKLTTSFWRSFLLFITPRVWVVIMCFQLCVMYCFPVVLALVLFGVSLSLSLVCHHYDIRAVVFFFLKRENARRCALQESREGRGEQILTVKISTYEKVLCVKQVRLIFLCLTFVGRKREAAPRTRSLF